MIDSNSHPRRDFRTAVSLHCHTQHSREKLDFIPHYAARIPVASVLFKMELRNFQEKNGRPMDFGVAHWTQPLSARQVFEHEVSTIENRLGTGALVSLTDHDTIEANTLLHVLYPSKGLPISLEWTVPFGGGMFHLGVHNLPIETSSEIMAALAEYTENPKES